MNGTSKYTYEDGSPVPYPVYRCKATMSKAEKPGATHLCKRHADHKEEKHMCICGIDWEPEVLV